MALGMLDFETIRKGFEMKYFIPSHIKFNHSTCFYETRCEGELFRKLEVQTNNMFSIWKDACLFASSEAATQ